MSFQSRSFSFINHKIKFKTQWYVSISRNFRCSSLMVFKSYGSSALTFLTIWFICTRAFQRSLAVSLIPHFLHYFTKRLKVAEVENERICKCWLKYNYKRYERFVSANWVFLQFSTSSPTNSLPFYGKLLRQSKVTLCTRKLSFKCFEIFLLSEWVSTHNKLYIYAKENFVL